MRWTLVGLVRHLYRQLWVGEVVRDLFGVDLKKLSRYGSGAHPRGLPGPPGKRPLPGVEGWSYFFHGKGCALRHAPTRQHIDVDFWDGEADWFDPWFYQRYLDELLDPNPPELKIRTLHHKPGTLHATWLALLDHGALQPHAPGAVVARLHPDLVAAGEDGLTPLATQEAPDARARRQRWLRERMTWDPQGALVAAYAALEPPDLAALLDEILAEPPTGRTSAALEILIQRADTLRILGLLARIRPNGPIPEPHLWQVSQRYLQKLGAPG